ncbi:MAG: PhzF family phenazine biosynthesis protein, partial [Anaerolineales bacterium]|nr:PhzF family phenazine biosynthesis protein [Anaerolineales bacterium]
MVSRGSGRRSCWRYGRLPAARHEATNKRITGKAMIDIYQVDAFTAEPFAGNPAAVCVLAT